MNRDAKKQRKAKKRQIKVKEKLRRRRNELREAARHTKYLATVEKHFSETMMPIETTKEPALTSQRSIKDVRKVDLIKKKLEHNMKILEALEAEIAAEEEARQKTKSSLEDVGANTLREQCDYLGNTAVEFCLDNNLNQQ